MEVRAAPITTLPTRLEELDADWLSSVLALESPGTVVTALKQGKTRQGSATKVSFQVSYNEEGLRHALPIALVVKGRFGSHGGSGGYIGEAHFYAAIAPRLPSGSPLRIPRCCYAAQDPEQGQAIVILEDLAAREVRFGDARRAESVDAVRASLEALSVLHAMWWGGDELDAFPWLGGGGALARDHLYAQMLTPAHWDACMKRERATRVPPSLLDRERVVAAVHAKEAAASGPMCLLHGDPHVGNMYFESDGAPGFLDWQTVMKGAWAHDVTYNLIGMLSVDDRRRYDRELLNYYLECLRSRGVDTPSPESAWRSYRENVVHGFLFLVCPWQMQPEAIIAEATSRFAAAAEDLDSFGLLLGGSP